MPQVVDVRKASEFEEGAVAGAINTPLDYLNEHLSAIPATGPAYVYCLGGYRSMIALSILRARGWHNLINVVGGYRAIRQTDIPVAHPALMT
jgi:rhodanese-related sulfurtransferase